MNWLSWFRPKKSRITPLRAFVLTSLEMVGYICPPSGVMAFYNNLTCPKSLMFVQGATHTSHPPKPWQTAQLPAECK